MCIYLRRTACTAFMADYIVFLPLLDRLENPESEKSGIAGLNVEFMCPVAASVL